MTRFTIYTYLFKPINEPQEPDMFSPEVKVGDSEKNEAFSFDMVTNKGTNVRTQTYVLPEKDKSKANDLEKKISKLLSGDTNIDVCTLLSILNKKMKNDKGKTYIRHIRR